MGRGRLVTDQNDLPCKSENGRWRNRTLHTLWHELGTVGGSLFRVFLGH
jgi:hypothetical protein